MLELTPVRKNKVNLADYNCEQDIDNRMLLSDSSQFDLEVIEEILFSPLKISLKKLARSIGCKEQDLSSILEKLSRAGLLVIQDADCILVEKEMRKCFELQVVRFDPFFKPDMEFLQSLLRKVPIHYLPSWYSIPRTSNNIFESIVEKYLLTPQIFQRYLADLNFADPLIPHIVSDLLDAPDFTLYSSDCIAKYNLTRRQFEEIFLLLEFHFICCLSYRKEDDHWIEIITPFYEWHQYLRFLKNTETPILSAKEPIIRSRKSDFAFIEDMSALLTVAIKKPISLGLWQKGTPLSAKTASDLASHCGMTVESKEKLSFAQSYLKKVLQKLELIQLACIKDEKIHALPSARAWLDKNLEGRSLDLYRSPLNGLDKNTREAEKSIKRVLHGGWVLFEEFFKGILVPLSEESVIMLRRNGKQWSYSLPIYGENEKHLLKETLFEWLFETGMIATGTCRGKDCFAVTPFGRFFFED